MLREVGLKVEKEKRFEAPPSLPSFVSWMCVCYVCFCVLLAREDVDSKTAQIRIDASSIRGQKHALWVEIALPLLRKNNEKPPQRPIKTINVANNIVWRLLKKADLLCI